MAFGTYTQYFLTNYLPYTMTLTDTPIASQPGDPGLEPLAGEATQPSASIPPGGDMMFSLFTETNVFGNPIGGNWANCELHYDFTDINGGQHRCLYLVGSSGNVSVFSQDLASDGKTYVNSTDTFQISNSIGRHLNVIGHEASCILSRPAEITIDAIANPAEAVSVMTNLWPQGTNQAFTVTAGPSYETGDWTRGSAKVINGTTLPATLTLAAGDSTSETTSLALTLAWSSSLNILNLVNQKLSASITGGQSWTQSVTTTGSESMTIDPGDQGWLEWSAMSAVISGEFTFTWEPPQAPGGVTSAGITYHVSNATVTEPGRSGTSLPAITWQPYTEPIGQNTSTSAGVGATSAVAPRPTLVVGDSAVVIDAATDPADAAKAMGLWPNATNQNFTATSNPVYSNTQPVALNSAYQVPASHPQAEPQSFTVEQTNTSSWSLGGSVGAETTLSALGFANASVSVTFTATHQWDTTHSDSQTITAQIPPGHIGWIEGSTGQVTFTGDYAFTANGIDYVVKNVTIINPGSADSSPMAAFTYYVVNQPLSPSPATAVTRPGWTAVPSTRLGQAAVPSAHQHEHEEHSHEPKPG